MFVLMLFLLFEPFGDFLAQAVTLHLVLVLVLTRKPTLMRLLHHILLLIIELAQVVWIRVARRHITALVEILGIMFRRRPRILQFDFWGLWKKEIRGRMGERRWKFFVCK
jgi:hypothetical protein